MVMLVCFAAVCVLGTLLAGVVHRYAGVAYVLCVLAVAAVWIPAILDPPGGSGVATTYLMRRCMLSFALFSFVMYIGVLPANSKLRKRLSPARAAYSIMACILALGHIGIYLVLYGSLVFAGAGVRASNVAVVLCLGLVLFVLMTVLGVTSVPAVKQRMNSVRWKQVQRLAYLFFALVYLHILMVLAPSAFQGSSTAAVNLAGYSLIFLAYAVLRVVRAFLDRSARVRVADH